MSAALPAVEKTQKSTCKKIKLKKKKQLNNSKLLINFYLNFGSRKYKNCPSVTVPKSQVTEIANALISLWFGGFWFQKEENQLHSWYKNIYIYCLQIFSCKMAKGRGRWQSGFSQPCWGAHAAGEVPSAQSPVWFRAPLSLTSERNQPNVGKAWGAQRSWFLPLLHTYPIYSWRKSEVCP